LGATVSGTVDSSSSEPSTEPSPTQHMEVDEISGTNEEDDCNFNEDQLKEKQKLNSIQCIQDMCITPWEFSRFHIPLCRMVYMPLVCPTLDSDIKRLEAEFTYGYQIGANIFYVSLTNEKGEERSISGEERVNWGPLWNEENNKFELFLEATPTLSSLKNRMFFICDGNHRYKAWTRYIERLHKMDQSWHISVDSICLNTEGKIGALLNAMHDVNK
jgi:hypothetical protein